MMAIYLLFPAVSVILDYYAYKMRGTIISFILAVASIGILAMGLPFLVAPTIHTTPQQIISAPSGNIIIQPYNVTYTQSQSTLSLGLFFGEIIIFPQFAYLFLSLSWVFTEYKRRRYA
jgi:hypothetical protein